MAPTTFMESAAGTLPAATIETSGTALGPERCDLALSHLGLADALARRYCRPGSDGSDLQQVARLGLVNAAIRFRPGNEAEFVAFASATICGEVKRYLRDHGWMVRPPRRVQELRAQVRTSSGELTQRLGREPTVPELADALSVGAKDVEEAMLSESSVCPQSLDATGSAPAGTPLADRLAEDDDAMGLVDDRLSLASALRALTDWERRLLWLRFQEELSQQRIAAMLGISQMQVSRALSALLAKLRQRLSED